MMIDLDFLRGRFGGEEFTVILTYADMALARVIAQRIRQDVAGNPFHAKGHIIEVTISHVRGEENGARVVVAEDLEQAASAPER
jgi:PleD family two-component response regulator